MHTSDGRADRLVLEAARAAGACIPAFAHLADPALDLVDANVAFVVYRALLNLMSVLRRPLRFDLDFVCIRFELEHVLVYFLVSSYAVLCRTIGCVVDRGLLVLKMDEGIHAERRCASSACEGCGRRLRSELRLLTLIRQLQIRLLRHVVDVQVVGPVGVLARPVCFALLGLYHG